jgi:hypothetical protein
VKDNKIKDSTVHNPQWMKNRLAIKRKKPGRQAGIAVCAL